MFVCALQQRLLKPAFAQVLVRAASQAPRGAPSKGSFGRKPPFKRNSRQESNEDLSDSGEENEFGGRRKRNRFQQDEAPRGNSDDPKNFLPREFLTPAVKKTIENWLNPKTRHLPNNRMMWWANLAPLLSNDLRRKLFVRLNHHLKGDFNLDIHIDDMGVIDVVSPLFSNLSYYKRAILVLKVCEGTNLTPGALITYDENPYLARLISERMDTLLDQLQNDAASEQDVQEAYSSLKDLQEPVDEVKDQDEDEDALEKDMEEADDELKEEELDEITARNLGVSVEDLKAMNPEEYRQAEEALAQRLGISLAEFDDMEPEEIEEAKQAKEEGKEFKRNPSRKNDEDEDIDLDKIDAEIEKVKKGLDL